MVRLFLGALRIIEEDGPVLAWLLKLCPWRGLGASWCCPPVVRDSKAACRLALSQGPGFLLGSHAAEKLEEWKYLDQWPVSDGPTLVAKASFAACVCKCSIVPLGASAGAFLFGPMAPLPGWQ